MMVFELFKLKVKSPTCPGVKVVCEEKTAKNNMPTVDNHFNLQELLTDKCVSDSKNGDAEKNGESVNVVSESPTTSLFPISQPPVGASTPANGPVDLGSVLSTLLGGDAPTAVQGILELTHKDENLPMKSNLRNPNAFSKCQVHADFSEGLGFTGKAKQRREYAVWCYQHNVAKGGERAKEAFNTLRNEVEQQKALEKEAKGLLGR